MPDSLREVIAYSIIIVGVLGFVAVRLATRKRRRQEALRRRGIKNYN